MDMFAFLAYGSVVLLGTVFVLSIWIVASNTMYVRLEQRNQNTRNQIKSLMNKMIVLDNTIQKSASDQATLQKLIRHHKKLVSGVIAQLVNTQGESTRATLIAGLEAYGLPSIAKETLHSLTSRHQSKRLWAAANLPYLAPANIAIPALRATLADNDNLVSLAAARSLSALHHSDSACLVIQQLGQRPSIPWTRIIEIIPQFGLTAISSLTESLASQPLSDDQRAITLAALGVLQATQSELEIKKYLANQNKHTRIQAAKALGNLPAKQSSQALMAGLTDAEWEVRVVCANALGKIADPEAAQALALGLRDPVYWVRYNSADALSKLGAIGLAQLQQGLQSDDLFARDICHLVLERIRKIQPMAQEAQT